MNIQWYPGHMAKARRLVEQNLKLVDVVIELVDARAPISSRNPMVNKIIGRKPRLVVLNKSDLADKRLTDLWARGICPEGVSLVVNSRTGHGINKVPDAVIKLAPAKMKATATGRARPVRCMIVGIPNVGKSLFINSLVRQKAARTGNKPGVTKGQQWIRVSKKVELLDTPGILWPKFDDPEVGFRLAAIGAIKEEVFSSEDVAAGLIKWFETNHPGVLIDRYDLSDGNGVIDGANEVIEQVAHRRGFIIAGGKVDMYKASVHILKEFREGKLGCFTLEMPPQLTKKS